MDYCWLLVALWVDGVGLGQAPQPPLLGHHALQRINSRLHGQILDFTHNHGRDRRIWSPALHERRDLYVYLPPCYDASRKYPMAMFLHGAAQDEQFFLQTQVEQFDRAIVQGLFPPVIIAVPDGSPHGRASILQPATFWANSRLGNFEDYVMTDVWNFMMSSFPILPERDAHALVGASMGGSAAFAHAIKYRDRVKVAVGFMPLLNLRYVDCHGRYRSRFDPDCFGMREKMHGMEILGRRKLFVLSFNDLFAPLFGRGPQALAGMSRINPLEMMERYDLRNGELDMFIAYGGKDEFNVEAQVESFLYVAHQRGIEVTADFDPAGKHDLATGRRQFPIALRWAAERVPSSSPPASPN
jgi:S-formylglutathione hydrolase FrmB